MRARVPSPECFNPRAPCGARRIAGNTIDRKIEFQSTRPVWGATLANLSSTASMMFQSTRPVWGATRRLDITPDVVTAFQSTRPVWGATRRLVSYYNRHLFQSTRPVWGATLFRDRLRGALLVSIHAPRVGRDYGLCR